MDDLHSILINLLSNVIWLPFGVLLAVLGYYISVRLPNRRLWKLKDPAGLVVCAAASTHTNTGVYKRPATGIGQVRALTLVVRSLNQAYSKKLDIRNILLSTDDLQDRIENDLLILGGPKNNQIAAHFCDHLADETPIVIQDSTIYWRTNRIGQRWVNQGAVEYEGQAINHKVVEDYGLVVRAQSPFTSRDSTVILFAGSHTYGVIAAAKFFTEDLHKQLGKLTSNGRKNFAVLVKTRVIEGYPTKVKVERYYSW